MKENPKLVLRQARAAQLRRARREDALDRQWTRECQLLVDRIATETGLQGFELMLEVCPRLPPKPPGFQARRGVCNRCGGAVQRDLDYDALFCPRCRRWVEWRCGDPDCNYCRCRPRRPAAPGP